MVMGAGTQKLHPLLRHHLVNTLGWRHLRPLQEAAIEPVTSGEHVLILAPTAGGKTEAAVFPVISRLLHEEWAGPSLLYICPLKALLNNLHERLQEYFGMIGHQCALWHGDINAAARKRIIKSRPACLLTTPESVESMLASRNTALKGFLSTIRVVIVDEIHAFAGDDRGTHLLCLLERLSAAVARPIQRLGLSATVGNPQYLLDWLVCERREPKRVLTAPSPPQEADVRLDYVGHLENAAHVIATLFRGEKRLVFCDSRRRVEELTHLLSEAGVTAYASHSSLSAENRRLTEEAFARDRDCVIVATSTLELGIDVGDLDRVIQIDAPGSVASFLQRIGRTGRRQGTERNCLFLATRPEALLQAAALLQLWERGFVEPIEAPRHPFHIAAQQVLTMCLENGRIPEREALKPLRDVPGISGIEATEVATLLAHLVDHGYLVREGGYLFIGPTAERELGRRHFRELLSVFSSAPAFEVFEGQRSIGYLDWLSLSPNGGDTPKPIILAGKSWEIQEIAWAAQRVYVRPSKERGKSRWLGSSSGLSLVLAQAVLDLLRTRDTSPRWTHRALGEIQTQREELAEIAAMAGRLYEDAVAARLLLPTFFGSPVNHILARCITEATALEAEADDFVLSFPKATDPSRLRPFLENDLRDSLRQNLSIDEKLAESIKFSACLPPAQIRQAYLGKVPSLDQALGLLVCP